MQAAFNRLESLARRRISTRGIQFIQQDHNAFAYPACGGAATSLPNIASDAGAIRATYAFPMPFMTQARPAFFFDGLSAAYLR